MAKPVGDGSLSGGLGGLPAADRRPGISEHSQRTRAGALHLLWQAAERCARWESERMAQHRRQPARIAFWGRYGRDSVKTLIIVESPNKAKSVAALARPAIQGTVFAWACLGHLRDLPEDELAVDVEAGFEPEYIIPKNRQKTVETLREKIAQADTVILATDPDREGEAVAWHVTQVFAAELQGKIVQRVAFNAITAAAIQKALKHPRKVDMRLVQAAVARRVLDRLVGYFVSPRLWAALPGQKELSAGRVQTAALRLLSEQEQKASKHSQAVTWQVEIEI